MHFTDFDNRKKEYMYYMGSDDNMEYNTYY